MGLEGINWKNVAGQDAVIHLMANNDTLCTDREEMMRANVYGPIKLFTTAVKGGCKRFVYASSTAIYGDSPAPYCESLTPAKPLNIYAESKLMFDKYAMTFAEASKVSVIGLRYCNIYGPGEEDKGRRMSMIGQIIRKRMKNQPIKLFEFGEQKRDWVYIKDVVRANALALLATKGNTQFICNIGSGKAHSFNKVVETIDKELNSKSEIHYIPCPFEAQYQHYTECKIDIAKEILGYCPEFDLEVGIKDYIASFSS
jgi:ADP-L-glycero-D-manno-heptose 6-epimerase